MKTFQSTIEWDDEAEEYVIPLPIEVIQETGWGYNDKLEMIDNKDGTLTIRGIIDGHC